MLESTSSARIVMTTVVSPEEAARLGRALVEERLAACATLLPAVHSIYHWKDKIESSSECLLLLKTASDRLPALEARLHELHSYQTPEFLGACGGSRQPSLSGVAPCQPARAKVRLRPL